MTVFLLYMIGMRDCIIKDESPKEELEKLKSEGLDKEN